MGFTDTDYTDCMISIAGMASNEITPTYPTQVFQKTGHCSNLRTHVSPNQPKNAAEPHPFHPYSRRFAWEFLLGCMRSKRLRVAELSDGEIRPDELMGFYDAARDGKPRLRQPIVRWE